jgi:hypothetical protein
VNGGCDTCEGGRPGRLTRPPHVQEHEGTLPVEPAQLLEVTAARPWPPGTQMSSRPVPTMRSVRRVPSNAGKSITEPRTTPRRESSDRAPDGSRSDSTPPWNGCGPCSVAAAARTPRCRPSAEVSRVEPTDPPVGLLDREPSSAPRSGMGWAVADRCPQSRVRCGFRGFTETLLSESALGYWRPSQGQNAGSNPAGATNHHSVAPHGAGVCETEQPSGSSGGIRPLKG